jgi:hypothetical protein
MNKKTALLLVLIVALAFTAIQGFRDGREHQAAPQADEQTR